ncbi:NPH1 [Symbiodinium sp. CCMP2456]|nr:NPH1 [Symbiodinium sp. CCMP2456]
MEDADAVSDSDEEAEEERKSVDSDEELNVDTQPQLAEDDEAEQVQPTRRLRQKTAEQTLSLPTLPAEYPSDAWPQRWRGQAAPKPGEPGFNVYAQECINTVLRWWDERGVREGHEKYQKTAACRGESLAAAQIPIATFVSSVPLLFSHPSFRPKDQGRGCGAPAFSLQASAYGRQDGSRQDQGRLLKVEGMHVTRATYVRGYLQVLITVLDQHFTDKRKKLPIFPTKALANNFYHELLRWPNKYRSYFAHMQPELAAKAVPLKGRMTSSSLVQSLEESESKEWSVPPTEANELAERLRIELEMTSLRKESGERMCGVNRGRLTRTFTRWFQATFPTKQHLLPGAPLRAMNLSTAGGSFSAKRPTGEARHPVAQFGYDLATRNVFDNAVVVIDEAHNMLCHPKECKLLRPAGVTTADASPPPRSMQRPQLDSASNLTLICLSGTPLPDNPKVKLADLPAHLQKQRQQLEGLLHGWTPEVLRILKAVSSSAGLPVYLTAHLFGKRFSGLSRTKPSSLEGFLCSYHGRLPGDSAKILGGSARKVCGKALEQPVKLPAVMAARYFKKAALGGKRGGGQSCYKVKERKELRTLQNYTNMEVFTGHMKQQKFEDRALSAPDNYAAKLFAAAEEILNTDLNPGQQDAQSSLK